MFRLDEHHNQKDCRAYPDEKGIETDPFVLEPGDATSYCRAYPDEKGIETN